MLTDNSLQLLLQRKRYLSPRILELSYQSEQPVRYLPGQFFSIRFPTPEGSKARSYSIVNRTEAIRQNHELTFVMTLIKSGAASEYFRAAELGSEVTASGPFGSLVLPRQMPNRLILIATGAGVAPYRSMLPQLEKHLASEPGFSVTLMLGVRGRDELLYGDEFVDLARRYNGFDFRACYSRGDADMTEPYEYTGYVQDQFDQLVANPDNDMIYLCGNPDMIDQSVLYFSELGFNAATMKREKYLFSAM